MRKGSALGVVIMLIYLIGVVSWSLQPSYGQSSPTPTNTPTPQPYFFAGAPQTITHTFSGSTPEFISWIPYGDPNVMMVGHQMKSVATRSGHSSISYNVAWGQCSIGNSYGQSLPHRSNNGQCQSFLLYALKANGSFSSHYCTGTGSGFTPKFVATQASCDALFGPHSYYAIGNNFAALPSDSAIFTRLACTQNCNRGTTTLTLTFTPILQGVPNTCIVEVVTTTKNGYDHPAPARTERFGLTQDPDEDPNNIDTFAIGEQLSTTKLIMRDQRR